MNALKTAWGSGGVAFGAWMSLSDAFVAEVLGDEGFDYVCIDMQHGLSDYTAVVNSLRALAGSAAVPLVRVPWNEPAMIGRVLDAGAGGVIVPMVNSPKQAVAAVAACRYAPEGSRSWGPNRVARLRDDYAPATANETVVCIPMIETAEAVANLDEILAVPGIDAVYVGPADLSITLGLPPAADNAGEFVGALEKIVASCSAAGVVPGIHTTPELVAKRRGQGFRMITYVSDLHAMQRGMANMHSIMRESN